MISRTLAPALALVLSSAPAGAQVSSVFLERWDLAFRFNRNSARLDAMGGVDVAVADETREINAWDYGRNVAGFLDDRDAWTGDFWAASRDLDRRTSGVGAGGQVIEGGLQLSFRSFVRALGFEGTLTSATDESRSGIEKHDFDGPVVSVVGNQLIGEDLVVGVGLSIVSESERIRAPDPLAIRHDTSRSDFSFGLLYYLGDKIDLGATAVFSQNKITGRSEDGFHNDQYDWDRPATRLGAQVIYGASASSRITGGAFIGYTRLKGGEVLDVSWSREFFINPSAVDLNLRVGVLVEDLEEVELGSRWFASPTERIDVGAEGTYKSSRFDAMANATFPGISETADEASDEWSLIGGLGLHPTGRLTLAGQVGIGSGTLDETVFDTPQRVTADRLDVRAGLEYFWRPDATIRGGFRFVSDTEETRREGFARDTEFETKTFSGGLGWAPGGGVFQLDMALGFADGNGIVPSRIEDQSSGTSFVLTGRTLFR